ncbi:phosphate ABC transporter substrate-binding protein [Pseudoalteromonas sp. MMG024]|uniref:phosphate ABC transporter substrate-binding protein n=1 Tax=Pseudoalteromonas sp. MMG024 TaxID=2909980 RepID=UPI001F3A5A85|nr:phosphate ABC transporter substrate-binding protein [Pseudoalteromonas sp. MMG024]MCF6457220.1 phosphate ABC transporter substrate-binding protein [Pseudoalteromonas sp. MMG024]
MLLPSHKKAWKVVCVVSTMTLFSMSNAFADVAIVVHPTNDSAFDQGTIKKIFLGKTKSYSNGRSAILISANYSDPATEEFNSKVIGKSSSQVKAYWSKILFTGKGTPPQEMDSNAAVISAVASNPDAIGYLDASAVTSDVKVVATF